MQKFRNLVICLLTLALVLSMAACGSDKNSSSNSSSAPEVESSTPSTEATPAPEAPVIEEVENPVTYFSLYMGEGESFKTLTAYDDGMGGAYVEFTGDIKKIGTLDSIVLHGIATALSGSGLVELNGQSEYADGQAMASMYIELADGSFVTADYSGLIPEAFTTGFEAMEEYFRSITAAMPEYVPQAQVMGEVDADILAAMQEILNGSGMDGLDMLAISDIAMDEYFAYTAGLSSSDGIANGASCSAMMMTTPYSLVIVTLEDANGIDSVRADFESSLDWMKWVCVIPTNALIAENGNMVLCLIGSDAMFTQTAEAIENAGWSNIATFDNPDM